jgi:hypothetical protein
MTHLTPGGETRRAAPLLHAAHPALLDSLGIDLGRLCDAIARRRAEIALIETEWVAACETRAARNAARTVRVEDRETWDRAMWARYLAAAAANQANYLPRLRRLYAEIARLEHLQAPLLAS